jgi:hypothetical protein
LYAAPRSLTLMSYSCLSLGASRSEGSPTRPPKQCVQMSPQPPKRLVRSTAGNTSVCETIEM